MVRSKDEGVHMAANNVNERPKVMIHPHLYTLRQS
jgi:hypothetical protein